MPPIGPFGRLNVSCTGVVGNEVLEATVTRTESLEKPPCPSSTSRIASNAPAFAYVCVGFGRVEPKPSPNVQV
jgi:hypothetical protein